MGFHVRNPPPFTLLGIQTRISNPHDEGRRGTVLAVGADRGGGRRGHDNGRTAAPGGGQQRTPRRALLPDSTRPPAGPKLAHLLVRPQLYTAAVIWSLAHACLHMQAW